MNKTVKVITVMAVTSLLMISASQAELTYLAEVNFAGKIFKDIIILDHPVGERYQINGTLTVPGAFTTKFVGYQGYQANPSIGFQAEAIENGNSLIIHGFLEGTYQSNKTLKGYLDVYIGDSKKKVRAPLRAILIHEDEK